MLLTDIIELIHKKEITKYVVITKDNQTVIDVKGYTISIGSERCEIKGDNMTYSSCIYYSKGILKNLNYWLESEWKEAREFFINDEKYSANSLMERDDEIECHINSSLDQAIIERLSPLFNDLGEDPDNIDTGIIMEDIAEKLIEKVINGRKEISALGLSFKL